MGERLAAGFPLSLFAWSGDAFPLGESSVSSVVSFLNAISKREARLTNWQH